MSKDYKQAGSYNGSILSYQLVDSSMQKIKQTHQIEVNESTGSILQQCLAEKNGLALVYAYLNRFPGPLLIDQGGVV